MDSLLIDVLDPGQLPLYRFEQWCERYYVWQYPYWNICDRSRNGVLVSTEIDEPLTTLVDDLPRRLATIRPGYSINHQDTDLILVPDSIEAPGTLIVSIRCSSAWDNFDGWLDSDHGGRIRDRHGVLVLCGIAFCPGLQEGIPLNGLDPVRIIEQVCMRLAGKEFDPNIPDIVPYPREARQVTPEDRVRVDALIRDIDECWKRGEEERRQAQERALAILCEHLDEQQISEFDAHQQFCVQGGDGFTYLITNKSCHNVFRIEDGVKTVEYCLVTESKLPDPDQMLAQKLLLEADPEMFHKKTNAWILDEGKRESVQFLDPTTFELRNRR